MFNEVLKVGVSSLELLGGIDTHRSQIYRNCLAHADSEYTSLLVVGKSHLISLGFRNSVLQPVKVPKGSPYIDEIHADYDTDFILEGITTVAKPLSFLSKLDFSTIPSYGNFFTGMDRDYSYGLTINNGLLSGFKIHHDISTPLRRVPRFRASR